MTLTKEEIKKIDTYIKSYNIKYYEIYTEILDHMILSTENYVINDGLPFEEAMIRAKNDFGPKGFKGLLKERQAFYNLKNRKDYLKEIKVFFSFPKILFTVSLIFALTYGLSFFEDARKPSVLLIALFLIIALGQCFYMWNYRKKEGFSILRFVFFWYGINSVALWIHFMNFILIFGKETIDFNHIGIRMFFSGSITLSFLSLVIFIAMRKKTIKELQSQIFI